MGDGQALEEFLARATEERDHGLDTGAARQQRRRLDAIGDWREHRTKP